MPFPGSGERNAEFSIKNKKFQVVEEVHNSSLQLNEGCTTKEKGDQKGEFSSR